jgi:hypothetical protein
MGVPINPSHENWQNSVLMDALAPYCQGARERDRTVFFIAQSPINSSFFYTA